MLRKIHPLLMISFLSFQVAAAEGVSQSTRPTTLEDVAKFNEILIQLDLVNKVASWNIAYLAIAVSVIIAVGFGNYIVITKPAQEKINVLTQALESSIEKMKRDFDQNIKSEAVKLEEKFTKLKKEHEDVELDIAWNNSYMWEGQNNSTVTLVFLLEWAVKCIDYKNRIPSEELSVWEERTTKCLKKINPEDLAPDIKQLMHKKLYPRIEKILHTENLKSDLQKEINRVFEIK